MNILDKLEQFEEVNALLMESGIRNMTKFAKQFKEAEVIFHQDL